MKKFSYWAAILSTSIMLEGCASMNLFKDDTPPPQPAMAAPAMPASPMPGANGALSATQIKTLLTGKSWRWASAKNAGVTLYASDGTSLVEVTGKGTTQGKWEARDGQLCEQFAPATFLPTGSPMSCQTFTGSNGNYMVGPATFKLAS